MNGPRTVDRIFAGETLEKPLGVFGWHEWPPPILATEADYRDVSSPVIAIDNVLEYLVRESGEKWDAANLPSVAPPFPSFWADCSLPVDAAWNRPGTWWAEDRGNLPTRFAVFFYAIRIDRDDPHRDDESVKGVIRLQELLDEVFKNDGPSGDTTHKIPEDAAWYIETLPFFASPKVHGKRAIIGPLASMAFFLNQEGRIPENRAIVRMKSIPKQLSNPKDPMHVPPLEGEAIIGESEEKSSFAAFLGMLTYPAFFAISLMHCKNVETVEYVPSPKEQKVARKKTGRELVSFHTLVVDARPTRRYLPSNEPRPVGDRAKAGLHIVRGHFKTFTKEAPLLGRAVGTFWWGQHLRGDEAEGLIAKDYDVRA